MILLISYVLLALVVSFLCSLLEASLLTITPVAIDSAKERGSRWAARMSGYKKDIERPLAAILTLNTIAHTMGAAGAGAQYVKVFGNIGEGFFAAALTFAILIFTEIIPKTLGTRFAIPLAPFTAIVLAILITALAPLVWVARKITSLISSRGKTRPGQHREELLAMTRLGAESGQLQETESRFVQNLIQLHAMKAHDIMTPRPVIFMLPESTTLADAVRALEEKPFSRIPVYGENPDQIAGFVLRTDALLAHLKNPDGTATLSSVKRPIAVTGENIPLDALFQRFISERNQIMIVVDEFGILSGLVSFEDIVETIFGFEIMDERDKIADLQLHARNLWKERARKMGIPLAETDSNEQNGNP